MSRSRARLAGAFEAERRRIERDLHDGAQQRLVSLTLQLGLARHDLPPASPAGQTVAAAHEQAKTLMAELRELIHGIQPQILTDLGLAAALGDLADQSPIPVAVDVRLPGRPPSAVENTVYFVAAEALVNVAKHSGASRARVAVDRRGGTLTVEISDNGRGGADPGRGTGLTGWPTGSRCPAAGCCCPAQAEARPCCARSFRVSPASRDPGRHRRGRRPAAEGLRAARAFRSRPWPSGRRAAP